MERRDNQAAGAGGSSEKAPPNVGIGGVMQGFHMQGFQATIRRIVQLTTDPQGAWNDIAEEEFSAQSIYRDYLLPTALLASVCLLLGVGLFSDGGWKSGVETAVFYFVAVLFIPFTALVLLGFLVPYFQGQAERRHMLAFAAFALLPVISTGLLGILPGVFVLSALRTLVTLVAAIFSVYLVWTGITPMLNVPADRRTDFFVAYLGSLAFSAAFVFVLVSALS